MTSQPPLKVQPRKPLTRHAIRTHLEAQRERLANLIVFGHSSDRPSLIEIFSTTTVLWEATQPDEAPDFEPATTSARWAGRAS